MGRNTRIMDPEPVDRPVTQPTVGESIARQFREPVVVLFLGVVLTGCSIWGLTDWYSYWSPFNNLNITEKTPPDHAEWLRKNFDRRIAERGQDAVLPLSLAVPMFFTGLVGALICFIAVFGED